MRRILATLAIAILFPLEGQADREMIHVEEWCSEQNGGRTEELLDDGTKTDCLTDTHAIEIKHAAKWGEVATSLGQAIYYAQQADRQPGIVLIIEDRKDCRYVRRLRKTLKGVLVNENPANLWTAGPSAEECQ